MIRVLVVDDSPTARALLVAIFSSDPEILVVGEAADGVEAVASTRKLKPDVITMDICMPRMDGFQATKEIMITIPTPIIILTGNLEIEHVKASLQTLRAGALTALAKPPGPVAPGFQEAAQQLIDNVKALSQVKVVRHWRQNGPRREGNQAVPRHRDNGTQIVTIAASTGGPAAVHSILTRLQRDFPAPLLVVQHISRGFAAGLADWLNKECDLHVKLAQNGETLAPHTAYLAPDDRHLGLSGRSRLLLTDSPPVGGFRPSGTFLFESAAQTYGADAIAVILTGMGEDGVEGLRAVRQAGGRIIGQDEKSSVIFGMPGAAIKAGLVDKVLPLEAIPCALLESIQIRLRPSAKST